jgi:5S rRNA maturation endonuclease (ribonuclease M5)
MNRNEIGEELLKLLIKLKEKLVIVEGKRDKKVLYSLGFKKIITINKGIYETTEEIKDKELLILTDFDNEGKQIAKKLNLFLLSQGYKVDRENRRKIGLMFSRLRIKKIEELRGVFHE